MEIAAIVSVIGALVTIGGLILNFRKSKSEIKVLNSQEKNNLAEALDKTGGMFLQALKAFTEEREGLLEERNALEGRIEELEKHREERTKRIEELERLVEGLNRAYVKETQELRDENSKLKEQITVIQGKYENAKSALGIMAEAMKNADITLPHELEVLLGDSIHGLKFPRERP